MQLHHQTEYDHLGLVVEHLKGCPNALQLIRLRNGKYQMQLLVRKNHIPFVQIHNRHLETHELHLL